MNHIFHHIKSRYLLQSVLFLLMVLPFQTAHATSPAEGMALPPNWTIDPLDFEFNMSMVIQVKYNGAATNAPGNMVGAFVGNELRGVGTPVTAGSSTYFFTTIYSNLFVGETVYFKVYYAPDDQVYATANPVIFRHHLSLGSFDAPFMLNINPNEDFPPQIAPIPHDTTLQGIPFASIPLNNYWISLDGDPVSWSAAGSANLNVALVNNVLTVTPVSPLWTGTDSVRVIVTENTVNNLADTSYILFTVLPDYGPPVWQTIPNQTIVQGGGFTPFDLDNYLTFNGPCRGFDYDVTPFSGAVANPGWPSVPAGTQPMNIITRVLFANELLSGAGAQLAAFVNGNLAGTATPTGTGNNITYQLHLANVGSGPIQFRFYDATNQYLYQKTSTLNFTPGASVGTISNPYVLQLSPVVPVIAANGTVQMNITDPSWTGTFPVNFIVWDCLLPTIRRDTTTAVFTVVPDVSPTIISPPTVSFEENACTPLYDAQSTDPNNSEGAGLTYSLAGGADAARFMINAQTGVLSWAAGFTPNFENPQDANTNNQYEVNIQVTNLANQSDVLALVMTVTNQQPEPFVASINGGASLVCTLASVNLQAGGGITYQWSNGSSQSAILVNTPGTYSVTATSSGGCTATASVVVAPTPQISAAGNAAPVCQGSLIQLSSTPAGGTAPYAAFAWAGPNSFASGVEDPAAFPATPAAAGTYTVTLTDAAGCTASGSATIAVSANTAPGITAASNSPVCVGATIVLTSTPSGGSGMGYTFLWAGPPNYAATGQNPTPFTAAAGNTGVYTVTVTDNAGCTGVSNTTVQVQTRPTVVAGSNSPVSVGANIVLTATASGGSGAGYSYQWAGPNNFNAAQAQPTVTASAASNGIYTVTVTDSNGCTGTATTTVAVVACPTITATNTGSACVGGNLIFTSTPAGGATPYSSFAWTGPNNFSSSLEDPLSLVGSPAASGTYTVTVTDALGCTATATTTVLVNPAPGITATNNGPMCQGSTVVLTSTPTGGSGVYTAFQWAGPDGFGAAIEDPASFTGAPANSGVYTVTVTDNQGCTATGTTTLLVSPKPGIGLTSNSPLCIGALVNLQTTPGGGAAPYIFNWTGPAGFVSALEDPTPFPATLANAGTYSVTVSNSTGCSNTASTTLTVSNLPAPTITAGSNAPVCAGQNLSLTSTPNGGSGVYTAFAWAGPNNYTSAQEDPAAFLVLANASGNYTVTVTDNNNCKGTTSIAITIGGPSVNPTSNSPVCPGGSITLFAGGTGQTYSWTGPNGFNSPVANPVISGATIAASGTYYVTVNDNGCLGFGSVTVTVTDITPPSITCPANTTVAADGNCAGVVGAFTAASVSDNCTANPAVTQSPAATTVLSGQNDVKTITLTADDGNGNTANCSFIVTLKDITPPSITCPANTTVAANTNCAGVVGAFTAASVSDNCAANPTVTQSPAAATVLSGHNDVETVTLTTDDGNGNTANCIFTVTLKDVTPPSISCPANTTVAADVNCAGVVGAFTAASISDNCAANPAVIQSPTAATVLSGHNDVETVTLTADDGNGNTANCTFTVTLKDVTPPSISCPANTTVAADVNCAGIVGAFTAASVSDNCAVNPTVTQSPAAATVLSGHNDVETVTLTANDGNGNTTNCTFTVTLKDVTPPSITCPANTTVAANANCAGVVGAFTAASVSDNCAANPTVTQSPAAATVLSGHNDVETVNLTADDGNGNTANCSFTVTLKDVTPPSITCPANTTVAADANCAGVVGAFTAASVSDNCAANPTVTQSPAAATVLSGHNDVETVTLTANDGNGNTASCTFTVTLKDVTPPSITCPANTTVAADASCAGVVGAFAAASVSDNCAANPTVTQSPGAATVLSGHNDVETVTLTADDGNGNTANCTFTVTLKDVTPPSITCPANTTVAADANCSSPVGAYNAASVSDNCTANPAVTQSPAAATVLSGHNDVETVTLTANDGNGNTASCTFTVTLKDITPPTVVCAPFTAALNAAGTVTVTTANVYQSGADNCGTVNQVAVTPNTFNCGNLGANTVVLTVNDGNGNTASCNATVTVVDNIAPTMFCNQIIVPLNAAGTATATAAQINNNSTDNCTLVSLSLTPVSFTCANIGINNVTLTGVDQSGNTATCVGKVIIIDNLPPTMLCKNATLNLDNFGQATLTVADINNGSFDNCSIVSLTLSQTQFNCAHLGNNNVILIGVDQSGNAASCSSTVTVQDLIAPVAKCKNYIASLGSNGSVTIPPSAINNVSTDNCSFTLSVTPATFTCANVGNSTVTLKATDSSGNTSTCTAKVTVKDATPPTAICQNATVYLNSEGQVPISASQINNGSTDNCGITSITLNKSSFNCSKIAAAQSVILTLKDAAGNTSTCNALVFVKDTIPPTAVCNDISVTLGTNGTVTVQAISVAGNSYDNCAVWSYSPGTKVYNASNIGPNNLNITVKDFSGNSSVCTAVVTVLPPAPPPAQPSGQERNVETGNTDAQLFLFPNPSSGQVTLYFNATAEQDFVVRMYDLAGRLVYTQNGTTTKGDNTHGLDLGQVIPGSYVVDVEMTDLKIQKRLVIQR